MATYAGGNLLPTLGPFSRQSAADGSEPLGQLRDAVLNDPASPFRWCQLGEALAKAKESAENLNIKDDTRADFIDMVERYYNDAEHFKSKGEIVLAFAALNYAHGWLDSGVRLEIFNINDDKLFTIK